MRVGDALPLSSKQYVELTTHNRLINTGQRIARVRDNLLSLANVMTQLYTILRTNFFNLPSSSLFCYTKQSTTVLLLTVLLIREPRETLQSILIFQTHFPVLHEVGISG